MSIDTTNITFGNGLLVAVVGMLVVFSVLVLLMAIIMIQTIIVESIQNKQKQAESAPAAAPAATAAPAAAPAKLAKGSCGGIALHDVPDATAAMVMAIVADELQTPLNELRFISIQEVK